MNISLPLSLAPTFSFSHFLLLPLSLSSTFSFSHFLFLPLSLAPTFSCSHFLFLPFSIYLCSLSPPLDPLLSVCLSVSVSVCLSVSLSLFLQSVAAALNARESVAFADMTQMSMNMPESFASLFHHQSPTHDAKSNAVDQQAGKKTVMSEGMAKQATNQQAPRPPSPISIPRAHISQGNFTTFKHLARLKTN